MPPSCIQVVEHILHSFTTDGKRGKGVDSHQGLIYWLRYHWLAIILGSREWDGLCRHSMVDNLTGSAHQSKEGETSQQTVFLNRVSGAQLQTPVKGQVWHSHWAIFIDNGQVHCVGPIPVQRHSGSSKLGGPPKLCFWCSQGNQVPFHPQKTKATLCWGYQGSEEVL